MTANQCIFLNVVAAYPDRAEGNIGHAKPACRSLYALVIGLFTARWTLMALGQTDYGLMDVVGGENWYNGE